ncbi:MAG: murein biosynthesis integral membrane protein MurJ [Bryobacteraceae bacterium]|nr:murein biosynthesis integral membrane protein MurJ [Bryobacteraceae bacterium]
MKASEPSIPVKRGDPQAAESMFRSAGITSIAVFLSRITGLVREVVMARSFGASMSYDAFITGFRIPNLTRDLFAEGALSSAFVPVFTQKLAEDTRESAMRLANLVATTLILVVGALCLMGMIFSPALVDGFASGFRAVEGKHELAVRLTRIMFPFLLVVALAAQAMGVLNALGQFAVPALSSSLFNLGSVLAGVLLGVGMGDWLGVSRIEGMAWGVIAGGILQLACQVPSLYRSGYRFRPELDFSDPGVRRILRLMGPAILGNAAVQINVFVNTNFASTLHDPLRGADGPVSWLSYAFRFMQLPLGLFGVAIASATLPTISRHALAPDFDDLRRTLSRAVGMVFLLTIPSSVGLSLLSESMIGSVYQGGDFNAYDTRQAGIALSYFAIGLAGYSALKVLTPAFYALGDSRTPMVVSVASVVINFFAVSVLVRQPGFGHAALAMSTSIVALFGFLVQFFVLRQRMGGIYGRQLLTSTLRILAASMVMGGAVGLSTHFVREWLGTSKSGYLADLAISIPVGALTFYGACRLLRIDELELAMSAMTGPLRRRFGR